MAVSAAQNVNGHVRTQLHEGKTTSISSQWMQVTAAGDPDDADNAGSPITDPGTQIKDSHEIITNTVDGTIMAFRLVRSSGTDPATDPVIEVFGRYNPGENGTPETWQRLVSNDGNNAETLATASDDVDDGSNEYTTVSRAAHFFDLQGCNEVLIGIKTAMSADANAFIEAKLLN